MSRTLKKFKLKYEYLQLEEEDVRTELSEYIRDFELRFDKYYNSIDNSPSESDDDSKFVWVNEETGETREEEPDLTDEPESSSERLSRRERRVVSRKLKTLYKKLASKMHPDTGGSHEDFSQLNEAFESGDLTTMLSFASEYDIEYEVDSDDEDMLFRNLKKIEDEISRMKNTMAWMWGTGDNNIRKHVIKMVQKQTGKKVIDDDLPESMRSKPKEVKKLQNK